MMSQQFIKGKKRVCTVFIIYIQITQQKMTLTNKTIENDVNKDYNRK